MPNRRALAQEPVKSMGRRAASREQRDVGAWAQQARRIDLSEIAQLQW
jgi:hypothetical protein